MKTLYKSLASFQQEVPVIHKDTQGYGYSYADLPAIFEIINPLLRKHNLGFTQPIKGKEIHTTIFHTETGESLESTIDIPEGVQLKGMNDYQVLGSAITYLRRYALSSILGLVTDKDTDGNGVEKKGTQQNKPQQNPPQQNQKPAKTEITTEKLKKDIDAFSNVDEFVDFRTKYSLTAEQKTIVTQKFNELFPNHQK
ncbi:hypothetical protein BA768_01190 [Chryseobacterium sp. CBo1]|uniref:ERF family protein n=1 Tax=Chryseobacterium sp. CBo1 TaxID=1869230 RepID=UPI000810C13A|nr:ERF family protein [Chryseobacterium sp. CBo1]OCK53199.1 hypothetical protein BA768_01190 [Chryseobacterium sp. CBo1]